MQDSVMFSNRKKEAILTEMTIDQMMAKCPNMFNEIPTDDVSAKYKAINVYADVVTPLMSQGWFVRDANAVNSKKKGEKALFGIHMANKRFANEERCPEIIIFSSHDRTKPLMFKMGMIEFVCSNGLVVVTNEVQELSQIKIRHNGDVEGKLQRVMEIIAEETAKVNSTFEKMKLQILTKEEQRQLAMEALLIREVPMTKDFNAEIAIKTCLQTAVDNEGAPIPSQDGDSLFSVFQRIQGNLTKGKVLYAPQGALVKAKELYDYSIECGDEETAAKMSKKIATYGDTEEKQFRNISKLTNITRLAEFNEKLFEKTMEFAN